MVSDPSTAYEYLKDAYTELQTAEQNGYTPAQLADLRGQVDRRA